MISIGTKRVSRLFTIDQLVVLEENYSRNKYIKAVDRDKLAAQTNLSSKQLQSWWQNRRVKDTRRTFSTDELAILEEQYSRSKDLTIVREIELADTMNLDRKRIVSWWNRRQCKSDVVNPTENRPVMQPITKASTSNPAPSHFTSSLSQASIIHSANQPSGSVLPDDRVQYHTVRLIPCQQAPEIYMIQNNGIGIEHDATASNIIENLISLPSHSDESTIANVNSLYSSIPSTASTPNNHQEKLNSKDLTTPDRFEEANTNTTTAFSDLRRYYESIEQELSEYSIYN